MLGVIYYGGQNMLLDNTEYARNDRKSISEENERI